MDDNEQHEKRYVDIASEVHSLMSECLAEQFDSDGVIKVDAVVSSFAFDGAKINARSERIKALLSVMHSNFHKQHGGGWSFLQLPMDADGIQWGEQLEAEALVALAIAAGMGQFTLPRDMWSALPGGVPYVVFDTRVE